MRSNKYFEFDDGAGALTTAIEDLLRGGVVAWFQGGSEFGPRALGHRSLLADPRSVSVRDHINRVIKRREWFRPFAPSVLEEEATRFFDGGIPSRFMLLTSKATELGVQLLPAVVHADGTSRLQTVPAGDGQYRELLERFYARTGCPALLDTSFNLRGEPIVETPFDALDAFVRSPIDLLVIQGVRVRHSSWVRACLLAGEGSISHVADADAVLLETGRVGCALLQDALNPDSPTIGDSLRTAGVDGPGRGKAFIDMLDKVRMLEERGAIRIAQPSCPVFAGGPELRRDTAAS